MVGLFSSLMVLTLMLWGSQATVFLNSTGDVKATTGSEVTLAWTASSEIQWTESCYFKFAVNKSSKLVEFLAFDNGKSIGENKSMWKFKNSTHPCRFGIRKRVSLDDAGVYAMKVDTGLRLGREIGQTVLDVYNLDQLTFQVEIDGNIHSINPNPSGLRSRFDVVKTAKMVTVLVRLSGIFPNTTKVHLTRNVTDMICADAPQVCRGVVDFFEPTVISIKTGIIGADTIIVSVGESNPVNVPAVVLGVFLVITVAVVAILLWKIRKLGRRSRASL